MTDLPADLFTCEPYRARLLPTACGRRWVVARDNGPHTRAGEGLGLCRGCDIGRANAAATNATVDTKLTPPAVARTYRPGPRTCACGTVFMPTWPAETWCDEKCGVRVRRTYERKRRNRIAAAARKVAEKARAHDAA